MLAFLVVSAEIKGVNADVAFYFVAIMNGASIIGRISAGLLGDRFGPLNVIGPVTLSAAAVTWGTSYCITRRPRTHFTSLVRLAIRT